MAIENDDLHILLLLCKYLPKNPHKYAALNHGARTSFEPQDAKNAFVHLTPFIVYYSIRYQAAKISHAITKLHPKEATLYLATLPHLWLTEQVHQQFLIKHVFKELSNDDLPNFTEIFRRAIVHCKFEFVEALLKKEQILENLRGNAKSSEALLEEVANTLLTAFKNNRLERNLLTKAFEIFDKIAENSEDISCDDTASLLTNLVDEDNRCVLNIVTYPDGFKPALDLAIKHTDLHNKPGDLCIFMDFLIVTDQLHAIKEIFTAQKKTPYMLELSKVSQKIIKGSHGDEILDYSKMEMTIAMHQYLSGMVTNQYIIPCSSQEEKKCKRSGIVYYDKDFFESAEGMRRALEVICGDNGGVGKEAINYEGEDTQVKAKFEKQFTRFLSSKLSISSLLIITIISHGHAGNIYLRHDEEDPYKSIPIRIKRILEIIRDQKKLFQREKHLPTVSYYS